MLEPVTCVLVVFPPFIIKRHFKKNASFFRIETPGVANVGAPNLCVGRFPTIHNKAPFRKNASFSGKKHRRLLMLEPLTCVLVVFLPFVIKCYFK